MKWRSSAVSSFLKLQKSNVWARLNSGVPWTPCSPPQLVHCGWKLWIPVLALWSVFPSPNLGVNDCTRSWWWGSIALRFCPSFTGFVLMCPWRLELTHILLVFMEVVCSVWSWHEMINDLCGCRYWSCLCQGVRPPPTPTQLSPLLLTVFFSFLVTFFSLLLYYLSLLIPLSSFLSLFFCIDGQP